jgi:Flp pilus assembly protein TadG
MIFSIALSKLQQGRRTGFSAVRAYLEWHRARADHLWRTRTPRDRWIRNALRQFSKADDGNIAIIFVIALIPILGFVGAAVDYSRASAARTSMQTALDSTALMLLRDISSGVISSSQVGAVANSYFSGLYTNTDSQVISVTASYTAQSGTSPPTVQVAGSGSIKTDFLNVIGVPMLVFNASATTTFGAGLLRIALVLDNTASMTDYNKIGALRAAAKNLVAELFALAANDGDVYISVIPFETDVNVGTSNANAPWLRWDLWDPSNSAYDPYAKQTWCTAGDWMTMAQCLGHGSTWNHIPRTSDTSNWNGCVSDRDQGYDVDSSVPSSFASQFVADHDETCPTTAILPLTYNSSIVNNLIDSMTASGATDQTVGLQWGWLSLLQQSPLNAPPEAPGATYQHIIVLFTDGLNTGNRWYGDYMDTSSQVDQRMRLLCDNIKAGGVTIYTVQIDTDGAGQSAVLPYCASNPGNFYMLTQPSQIASAFQGVMTSISKLRISK